MTITHETFISITTDKTRQNNAPFSQLGEAVGERDLNAIETVAVDILGKIDEVKNLGENKLGESPQTVIGRALSLNALVLAERAWEISPTPATEGLVEELTSAYPESGIARVHKSAFTRARIEGISFHEALDIAATERRSRQAKQLQQSRK